MKFFLLTILVICLSGCANLTMSEKKQPLLSPEPAHVTDARWASSENLEITINAYGKEKQVLTRGHEDFKPSWSKEGHKLTFFRRTKAGIHFADWKTKLCVIGADGNGFRELTNGDHIDFNPTWTRDGSHQIIFNRYAKGGHNLSNEIYLISPDGLPGSQVRISNPENKYEWAYSGLKDGRILVDVMNLNISKKKLETRTYLLTPNPGGIGTYEEMSRPTEKPWHKTSLSPNETKIAYMLDNDGNPSTYADVVLCYADFDVTTRTISNQVPITSYRGGCIDEYPRWSADDTMIIYDSSCHGGHHMYAYNLADKTTVRISPDDHRFYSFGNFEGLPK